MEAYYEILSQCPLFTGITRQEMPEILNCLDKKVVEIPKGDPVFLEGELPGSWGSCCPAGCRSSGTITTETEAC